MIKNKKQTAVINSISIIFDQTTMAQCKSIYNNDDNDDDDDDKMTKMDKRSRNATKCW